MDATTRHSSAPSPSLCVCLWSASNKIFWNSLGFALYSTARNLVKCENIFRIMVSNGKEVRLWWTCSSDSETRSEYRVKLNSWIKTDQLDVTCFIISLFNAQRVSNVSTSILRSLRLICYFMGCIALVRCVLVLRCGLAVVVWYPDANFSLHKDTTPHHTSRTTV